MQTLWLRTKNESWLRLTKFFGTLFLINFGIGVATGLVQEFQFGMDWSVYSRSVGNVFGAPLAIEGLAAFFLEATFLGLWIFGWNRGATVLSLGMTFTVAQLLAPLRRVWLVVAVVVLSAVVIPAVAWGIAAILPINDTYVDGLVLATLGAGSAGAIKAAQLAKNADLPLAVSMVVVLQLVN